MEEIIIPGQKECSIGMDIIQRWDEKPFVCLTVNGPENALCLRLDRSTLKVVRSRIDYLLKEMRDFPNP